MRQLLAAILLLAAACEQPEPLEGIDLPPASLPDQIDSAQWALAFSHDFGPDFWPEGLHVYQLFLDCPVTEEATQAESGLISFAAGPEVPVFDDPVRLRLAGLSTTAMGPPNLRFVSTEQTTTAVVTVVGLSEEQVAAAADCAGEIQWDDGQSAPLLPGEPFRP